MIFSEKIIMLILSPYCCKYSIILIYELLYKCIINNTILLKICIRSVATATATATA